METISRTQIAVRLRPEVMARVKYRARGRGMSVNAYIEEMLDLTSRPAPIPKLPPDMELDPVIKRLIGCIPPIPQEVIDEDPKLAYILGKGEV